MGAIADNKWCKARCRRTVRAVETTTTLKLRYECEYTHVLCSKCSTPGDCDMQHVIHCYTKNCPCDLYHMHKIKWLYNSINFDKKISIMWIKEVDFDQFNFKKIKFGFG